MATYFISSAMPGTKGLKTHLYNNWHMYVLATSIPFTAYASSKFAIKQALDEIKAEQIANEERDAKEQAELQKKRDEEFESPGMGRSRGIRRGMGMDMGMNMDMGMGRG